MAAKNIWLLTEERPKTEVIEAILKRFCKEINENGKFHKSKILPVMKDGKFTFCYKFVGMECEAVNDIYIQPVSGYSSFVDFLLFYQDNKPEAKDKPIFLIEETKTDDQESRNTGTYQRATKFIATNFFYPKSKNIMLYNLKIAQKDIPTATYIFGTRMLATYGVEIIGKKSDDELFKPFQTIDELISSKNNMASPRNGVPVKLKKEGDTIKISAKLEKAGKLGHDPNIGMLSIMSGCLRKLGWRGRIIVTNHGLPSDIIIRPKNKFNYVAHENGIELESVDLPDVTWPKEYWKPEKDREKTGTIFLHVIIENMTQGKAIYENHGGCERGYFMDYLHEPPVPMVVKKYSDRQRYKDGDKSAIIYIPDLVLWDKEGNEIYNIEGKTFLNRHEGVIELDNFNEFEETVIKRYYPGAKIRRSLVLAGEGSAQKASAINQLSLYLASDGSVIVGDSAGKLIKKAVGALSSL